MTTATAALSLVALIILLPLALRGGSSGSARAESGTTTPTVAGAQDAGTAAPTAGDFRKVDAKRDHLRGDKNAKVTVIEYSDLECPFCKRHHPVMQQLLKEYEGKINWVYRHFPLDSLHPKARKEAEASECAAELGGNEKFWEYIDLVYAETPSNNGLDPTQLPVFAERIGLNTTKFQLCLDSGKYASLVTSQTQVLQQLGVQSTPTFVVNGQALMGAEPFETFQQLFEQELGK